MAYQITEEQLAGLTDEERAALEEAEEDNELGEEGEDLELGEEGAGDDAGDDGADDDAASEEGEEGEDTGADDEGKEVEGDDGGEQEDPAPKATDPAPAPLLTGDVPHDFDDQVKAIGAAKDELDQKFEDGDLSTKEYRAEMDKLNKAERQLEMQEFKARTAQEMAENQQRAQWASTVQSFLGDHPEYGTSQLRYQALDTMVKKVASDEANAGLSGAEILAKAHELVEADLGGVPAAAPAAEPAKPAKPKKGATPKAPPTLAKVPAADATDVGNSKFALLDRLADTDPLRYEAEMAKLSPEEADRYLAGH